MTSSNEVAEEFNRICTEFADKINYLLDSDSIALTATKVVDGTVLSNYFVAGETLLHLHGTSGLMNELVKKHTQELYELKESESNEQNT